MPAPTSRPSHRWKHPVRDLSLAAVGLLVAAIGSVLVWALTAEPGDTVDYAAEIEALAVAHQPPQAPSSGEDPPMSAGNAWQHLQDAISSFDNALAPIPMPTPPGGGTPYPIDFDLLREGFAREEASLPPASSPDHAAQREWLSARREAARTAVPILALSPISSVLDRVVASPGGWRTGYTSPLYHHLLPDLGQSRRLAWYLAARMREASATGDTATALAAFEQGLAIARVLAHQPLFIDRVVATAISREILWELILLIETGSMSADDARAALDAMDRQLAWPGLEVPIEGIRLMIFDLIQQTHSAGGLLPGRLLPDRLDQLLSSGNPRTGLRSVANVLGLRAPSQLQTERETDRLIDGLRSNIGLNARQRADHGFSESEFLASLPRRQAVLRAVLATNLGDTAFAASDAHESLVGLTRLRLALLIRQQVSGAYPAALDELIPDILPSMPRDPMADDGRYLYRTEDVRFAIWSVGMDGIDNGGAPAAVPFQAFETGFPGTDLVLTGN